ncbi:MAG: tetratricopeptide (TPR) repeat protein [Candidatus Poriferisodalaceae bacterium]|jgi:tetratricopeptide (TPR) repeat protein
MSRSGRDIDRLAELEEQRDFLLRSLDDLEAEHGAGDLADDEFETLRDDYTSRAAQVLRSIEDGRERLPTADPSSRRPNALIFAVVLVLGAAAGLAVRSFAGQRAPGQTITGEANQSIRTRLVEAQQTFVTGDYEATRTAVDEILKDDASLPGALLLSAQLHLQETEVLAALQQLDQIIAADPLHVDALTLRGWTLVRIDDPELQAQGVESLDTALAQNPSTFDPYLFRGFVARNLELDLPRAIELYELALEHNPPPAMEVQISANIEEMQAELNA